MEKDFISGALRIGHLVIDRVERNTNQVQEVVRIQLLRDRFKMESKDFERVQTGATHATEKGLDCSGRRLLSSGSGPS